MTVVDLWSLGVIILEYAHGLPSNMKHGDLPGVAVSLTMLMIGIQMP